MSIDEAIAHLQARRNSLRCSELIALLEGFGFVVKPLRVRNHYGVKHPKLDGFLGSNFAGKHGKNPEVKGNYITKIKMLIDTYKDELKEIGYE